MKRDLSAPVATSLFPAAAFAAALAFSPLATGAAPVVRIDGSSTVYPIVEAIAQEFQRAKLH